MAKAHTIARQAGPVAQDLTKLLLDARRTDQGLGSGEIFHHFVEALLAPFGIVTPDATLSTETQEAITAAAEAYGATVRQEAPFRDVLGGAYMAIASQAKHAWMGQYFTPWDVASMLARMNDIPESIPRKAAGELVTIADPACGSGVLLLASLNHVLEALGPEGVVRCSVSAFDIDRICARMAAAQLLANWALHDLPIGEIRVVRADTLRMIEYETVVHATYAPSRTRSLHRQLEADVVPHARDEFAAD